MCNLQHYKEQFNIRIMKIGLGVEAGMAFKSLISQTLFLSNNNDFPKIFKCKNHLRYKL